jgi:hypothetical protein
VNAELGEGVAEALAQDKPNAVALSLRLETEPRRSQSE